jgi:hypothetical protein
VLKRLFGLARRKEEEQQAAGVGAPVTYVPILRIEAHVAVLELMLRELPQAAKEDLVTRLYTSLPPTCVVSEISRRLHSTSLNMFMRAKLVKTADLDFFISHNMSVGSGGTGSAGGASGGNNAASAALWAEIGSQLIRFCVIDSSAAATAPADPKVLIKDFAHILEALNRAAQDGSLGTGVTKSFERLMNDLRLVSEFPNDFFSLLETLSAIG